MNEKIQNYLNNRKKEIALEHEKEKHQLLEKLKLGERVYSDSPIQTLEYPLFDNGMDSKQKAYKIDSAQDLTEEEYNELLKHVPDNIKPTKYTLTGISLWYYFSIILMIAGIIGGIILASDRHDQVVAGVSLIISSVIFFSQIILLARIEYNTRKK